MPYTVTSHGIDADGRRAPAAIDLSNSGQSFSLDDALNHARQLLTQNIPNVAIQDGKGRSISGDDLAACCRGEKTLTDDLKVVQK